ncbi:MAG: metallophosphoesterase [Nanoarchaeota archaeon]|nr:metallophosphoesterase [Nanoarchaeota archaeon]
MKIYNNIEITDLALKYRDHLIIADLHIGLEEALNKQGILIPRFQFSELKKRLQSLLTNKIKTVVINGDLKHEFGTISEQEWRHTLQILDLCLENNRKVILIQGNHDTILGPIAQKKNLEILEKYEIDNLAIIHGNKIIETKNPILIIGHEHSAVKIKDSVRNEVFKCFLKGKYKKATLIVQPSFDLVSVGSNILTEKILSPYISNIENFEVFVTEENKVYNFGKVSNLK